MVFGLVVLYLASLVSAYTNPIINQNLPDPTVIRAENGNFYILATENIRNVPIYRSKNLVNWDFVGTVFTNQTHPNWEPGGEVWAPDINYINGQYVLYYAMGVWGCQGKCGIGIATASNPEGPWTDRGKLFRGDELGTVGNVDAFYIEDGGKHYLFWGSLQNIWYIELESDGLSFKSGAKPVQIAGNAFEGVYIHKRGNYYYMFASIGSCCDGVDTFYELVVARSRTLLGTYVDKTGKSMMNNGYTVVISANDRFVGNGHCSEIVQDAAGNDWIFFHGWDVTNADGRKLLMDQILWDRDGWPYIQGGTPSITHSDPVF